MANITVFISYSRKDTAFAERLKADLRAVGVTIWIDHESLQPGAPDWQAAIRRGIEAANAVIYIGSPNAAQSLNVRAEIVIATEEKRQILPIWAGGEQWSKCAPFELIGANYLDARDAAYATALARLCQTLDNPTLRTPKEMAQLAVEQGTALLGNNQYEEALTVFEQAVALDPRNVDAWAGKGLALYGLGRFQEALVAAGQAQSVLYLP